MSLKIALLIDAENISHKYLFDIVRHASRQGDIVLHAVYGNWANPNLRNWYEIAQKYNFKIRPNTAKTRNSTDMKLIMDAMEVLLILPWIDTYCLVTSDSDYVPLANKLHEDKKYVIGMGYHHAAEALIRSCDQFIFIGEKDNQVQAPPPKKKAKPAKKRPLKKLLNHAFSTVARDAEGWAKLSDLNTVLQKIDPNFNPQSYGGATLKQLLQKQSHLVAFKDNSDKLGLLTQLADKDKQKVLKDLVSRAFLALEPELSDDGWVTMSALSMAMREIQQGFSSQHYGHSTLTKLLLGLPDLVEIDQNKRGNAVRLKNRN